MKAQRRFGLKLSWPRLTMVFLIDVAVLVLASNWPGRPQDAIYAWWSGVGIAAVIAIVALVAVWRTPLTTMVAARVLDRFTDPEAKLAAGRTPPIDHRRRFGRDTVGIREHRGRVISVIAAEGRTERRSGRHHYRVVSPVALPVGSVAAWLRQFDVHLDAIDIVSVGTLGAEDGERADADDDAESDEEHRPVEHRGTWLVLRMDPQCNTAAIAARDSVASTLAAATERIAQEIDGTSCAARPLTGAEIAEMDGAVLAGLQPDRLRARRHWLTRKLPVVPREWVTSFWVSPSDITTETLGQLWLSDAKSMVMTTRIATGGGGTEVSAWVRYHSDAKLEKQLWVGLNRLTGRQVAAVHASLPVPMARSPIAVPTRMLDLDNEEELEVPVGSASQYSTKQVDASP